MARSVITVSVAGAGKIEAKFTRAQRELDQALFEEFRTLAPEILAIFQAHAAGGPRGKIGRGLQVERAGSTSFRPSFSLVSTYRTSEGFDPLGVTRFGHRRRIIRPRADRGEASVLAHSGLRGPSPDKPGGKPTQTALRLLDRDGNVIFRHYVKGVRHQVDWVKEARSAIQPAIDRSTERLGRKVVSALR